MLLWVSSAHAVVVPTIDDADTLKPRHIEASGFLTGGPEAWALSSAARIGVIEDLDFTLRLGALVVDRGNFQMKSDNAKDGAWHSGVEVSTGLRFRLFRWERILSFAIAADVGLAKTADIIFYGFDPRMVISHRRMLTKKNSLFFTLSGGAALTHKDSGQPPEIGQIVEDLEQIIEGDHTRFGPLFSMVVGYGLNPKEFIVFDTTYRSNALQFTLGMGRNF